MDGSVHKARVNITECKDKADQSDCIQVDASSMALEGVISTGIEL